MFGIECSDKIDKVHDLNILVLGNSITQCDPLTNLGWHGNWGMAATVEDKDFVHQLDALLEQHPMVKSATITPLNINSWERTFTLDTSRFAIIF